METRYEEEKKKLKEQHEKQKTVINKFK